MTDPNTAAATPGPRPAGEGAVSEKKETAAPQPGPLAQAPLPAEKKPAAETAAQPSMAELSEARAVKSGAEFGMNRFCNQSFVSPEAARVGSQALLTAFDDSGLWLASLVQPVHLVAELRQQCCLLTRVVITQWTHQGETLKLVRLGDALLETQPPVATHEAGQILTLLASVLGILRPAQAPRWLDAGRPLLKDSVDPHLLKDAAQWVAVGQFLATVPQEDRVFWNRRLRDPLDDWDWDSPEALDALRRLSPLLKGDEDFLALFQAAVPRCWWELWREGSHPRAAATPKNSSTASRSSSARALPSFALGLTTGVAALALYLHWDDSLLRSRAGSAEVSSMASKVSPSASDGAPADKKAASESWSFHPVPAVTAAPAPVVEAVAAASQAPASLPAAETLAAAPRADASPAMQARLEAAGRIVQAMPELERLYSLVRTGSVREALPVVQGRSMMAAQGSRQHRALLRWLMLDPPVNADVREQVGKAAVRLLQSREMYETLQLCLHAGSPNLAEARECASLFLALGGTELNAAEKESLTAMAK